MTLENAIACVEGYSMHSPRSDIYVFWQLTSKDSLTEITYLVAIIRGGSLYIKDGCTNIFDALLKKDCTFLASDLYVRGEI